jgi:hypothetical protein
VQALARPAPRWYNFVLGVEFPGGFCPEARTNVVRYLTLAALFCSALPGVAVSQTGGAPAGGSAPSDAAKPAVGATYCRGKDKFIFKTISTERPLSRFLNFNKEQKKIFIYDTNENFVEKINVDKVFNKYKIDKLDINTSKDNALFAAGPLLLVIYISLMSLILYGKIRIKRE